MRRVGVVIRAAALRTFDLSTRAACYQRPAASEIAAVISDHGGSVLYSSLGRLSTLVSAQPPSAAASSKSLRSAGSAAAEQRGASTAAGEEAGSAYPRDEMGGVDDPQPPEGYEILREGQARILQRANDVFYNKVRRRRRRACC